MIVAGLLLAAGSSTRMGNANKLLQTIDTQPMIVTVIAELMKSSLDELCVVTGFQTDRIQRLIEQLSNDGTLTKGKKIYCVENTDFLKGLSTSLKCGIQSLPLAVDAVMVVQADMPKLSAAHFDTLLSAYKITNAKKFACSNSGNAPRVDYQKIIAPCYQGRRGNPIIFPRRFFESLKKIQGDQGARQLLKQSADQIVAIKMSDSAVLMDVDTPAQLEAIRSIAAEEGGL